MDLPPATPGGGARSAELDGLRALAALSVFGFHAWLYTRAIPVAVGRSTATDYVLHELRLGLVLFFVLSGFLLYRPWVAAALSGRPAPSLRRYALRRAMRVAPAYYVAVLASVALLWNLGSSPGVRLPSGESLPLFAVFAQNFSGGTLMTLNPPTWTLAVEVTFYVALPLLGALAVRGRGTRRRQALVPLLMLLGGLATNATLAAYPSNTWSKTLPALLPYFALGMLAAVLVHGRRCGPRAQRLLLAGGLTAVLADALLWSLPLGADATPFLHTVRDVLAGAGFAVIVGAVAAGPPLRAVSALASLGTISYGLYLWHVPLLVWARARGFVALNPLAATAAVLPASALVAAASWRWVERPALAWARGRLAPQRSAAAALTS